MLTPILTGIYILYVNASNDSPSSSGLSVTIIKSAQTTKEKLKILDEVNGMDLTPLEQVLTKKKVANSTRPEKELRGVNAPQAVLSHPRNCEVDGIYLTRLNFKKEDKCT
uniref:Uncharacterized protein n=1 Tax=Wuchereria bancrofti TaxID=6293 RepID=A0AAF5PHG9_WUCBA